MGGTQKMPEVDPTSDGDADWHSVRAGIEIIASKWTLSVMAELSGGPKRHNELSRALNVDHKQLGRVLRRLQQARVVCRETDAARTPCRYRLTRSGRDLLPLLTEL